MAIDADQKPSRTTKHHRNSADESERTSKRHKHRHHHHRRHKHHHRSKKHDDIEIKDVADVENASAPVPPPAVVSNGNWQPDYDMEEGEIVDDDRDDTDKKLDCSIQLTEAGGVALDGDGFNVEDQNKKGGSDVNVMGEVDSGAVFKDESMIVGKGGSSLETELCDSVDLQRSSSVEHHVNGGIVKDKNNKYLSSSRCEVLEIRMENRIDENESIGVRKSSQPETPIERRKDFEYSPSQERYNEKYHRTSRSTSRERDRERSRSQSIIHDVPFLHTHHRDAAYDTERKRTLGSDEETISKHQRAGCVRSRDSSRDKRRERSLSYGSRHGVRVDVHIQETSDCNRDINSDDREVVEEKDRNRERKMEDKRERERSREMEKNRERERSREMEKNRERERSRENNRERELKRDRNKERERELRRDRSNERERERGRERGLGREIEIGGGEREKKGTK